MTIEQKLATETVAATEDDLPTQLDLPRAKSAVTQPLAAVDVEAAVDEPAEPVAAAPDDAPPSVEESTPAPPVRSDVPTRPRRNTLAMAIRTPAASGEAERARSADSEPNLPPAADVDAGDLPEGIVDEVDEWSVADQPTVYLAPKRPERQRPEYLETGEGQVWPPRPAPAQTQPATPPRIRQTSRPATPIRGGVPTAPRPDVANRPIAQDAAGHRLAAPDGRPTLGTPPAGIPRSAYPNPRMTRFQELRRQRSAHEAGERATDDARPVAELVKQWWSDLTPGLSRALDHQREARASGIHPIPAYEPATTTRLGDAFGRLAASARELTGRAQAAAAPTFRRLHDQAEQAAQALVGKIEGSPAQQQAPLLGPGRIAVFFKQGVTVGQAQRLLAASHARPIRLIPRKHGFLALVPPGAEAEIGGRLREHPYVRDVAFLEYNEYGEAIVPEQ